MRKLTIAEIGTHFSVSPNWCGRCDPFSTRLSIRFMPLTGRLRQKRRWRNEFCGPHLMESPPIMLTAIAVADGRQPAD